MQHTTADKGYYVTKFIAPSVDFVVCGLSNGQFLGWDLAADNKIECPGHDPGRVIKNLHQFNTNILSSDNLGSIQIRDFAN